MKFTQIPANTFKQIVLNAGIVVDSFVPSTKVIGNIIGATSGGVNFTATPTYTDYGDDIDNCPKNMMELKKLDSWETIRLTGTLLTVTAATAKMLVSAADIDDDDATHIIPRNDVLSGDFTDVWWVGDYSDVNDETNGGFCAVHLMNTLNTSGFQIQSGDKAKGTFPFEYTAHYSMEAQDEVPFEIYIEAGTTTSSGTGTGGSGTGTGN
jgi:hypothetical protein